MHMCSFMANHIRIVPIRIRMHAAITIGFDCNIVTHAALPLPLLSATRGATYTVYFISLDTRGIRFRISHAYSNTICIRILGKLVSLCWWLLHQDSHTAVSLLFEYATCMHSLIRIVLQVFE